jgi:antitoxin (DNA-binding transcriptional repressor) of toxin-antitoxin stability system
MRATMVDLRYRTKQVFRAIERGETVTILHRGKEKARLVPLAATAEAEDLRSLEAFGLWKKRTDMKDVPGYVRRLRQRRFRDL